MFKATGAFGSIHVDCPDTFPNNIARLNWIFNSENSYIEWFDVLPNKHGTNQNNPPGDAVLSYSGNSVKLAYKIKLDGLNIINTGIPHRAVRGSGNRFCYAFCLKYINGTHQNRLEWVEAVEILKPWIVEDF